MDNQSHKETCSEPDNMENETKIALFVGGNADGWTKEIDEIEIRLSWQNSSYLSRGTLETKEFGTVQVYVLEEMKSEEENQRMQIIRKFL
jgi:hypothetical protein